MVKAISSAIARMEFLKSSNAIGSCVAISWAFFSVVSALRYLESTWIDGAPRMVAAHANQRRRAPVPDLASLIGVGGAQDQPVRQLGTVDHQADRQAVRCEAARYGTGRLTGRVRRRRQASRQPKHRRPAAVHLDLLDLMRRCRQRRGWRHQ